MTIPVNMTGWWAVFTAAAIWLRVRATERVGVSPVSSDWLVDLERKSIRGHF